MKYPLQYMGPVPEELLEAIPQIRKWLRELPEQHTQRGMAPWSTHALVRAAVDLFPLKGWTPVDGYFWRRQYEHAWLAKRDVQTMFVLDIQPKQSMGGPLVVSMHHSGTANSSPWAEAYNGDGARFSARMSEFLRDASELIQLGK